VASKEKKRIVLPFYPKGQPNKKERKGKKREEEGIEFASYLHPCSLKPVPGIGPTIKRGKKRKKKGGGKKDG